MIENWLPDMEPLVWMVAAEAVKVDCTMETTAVVDAPPIEMATPEGFSRRDSAVTTMVAVVIAPEKCITALDTDPLTSTELETVSEEAENDCANEMQLSVMVMLLPDTDTTDEAPTLPKKRIPWVAVMATFVKENKLAVMAPAIERTAPPLAGANTVELMTDTVDEVVAPSILRNAAEPPDPAALTVQDVTPTVSP